MDPVGVADPEGNFSLTIGPSGYDFFYLAAYTDGFGVDWVDLRARKGKDPIIFRLPKDLPITGRVVSTEGKPIAGVSVSAVAVFAPANEKLDAFLDGWRKNIREALAMCEKRLFGPLDGITGAVTTDQDGRFTLRGAGAERMVRVRFCDGRIARSAPFVITRPGFDPKPYNNTLLKKEYEVLRSLNRFLGLYPPSLTVVAETGKTIEGVIKDAASGPLVHTNGWPSRLYLFSRQAGEGTHSNLRAGGRERRRTVQGMTCTYRIASRTDGESVPTICAKN